VLAGASRPHRTNSWVYLGGGDRGGGKDRPEARHGRGALLDDRGSVAHLSVWRHVEVGDEQRAALGREDVLTLAGRSASARDKDRLCELDAP